MQIVNVNIYLMNNLLLMELELNETLKYEAPVVNKVLGYLNQHDLILIGGWYILYFPTLFWAN